MRVRIVFQCSECGLRYFSLEEAQKACKKNHKSAFVKTIYVCRDCYSDHDSLHQASMCCRDRLKRKSFAHIIVTVGL